MTIDERAPLLEPDHPPVRAGGFWLKRGFPVCVTTIVVFGFLALSAFFTLPSNVLVEHRTDGLHDFFATVAAQDFAFFTKNPEEPAPFAFAVAENQQLTDLSAKPQNSPSNLFGLTRTQRAQGPEIATLMNNDKLQWSTCSITDSMERCGAAQLTRATQSIKNRSPLPTICGEVVFITARPVPWAFRDMVPYTFKPEKAAHVTVRCLL